jgi:hypothetical protein
MPKTRDEKFKESMNEFLENNVYINDDYYRFHYGLRNTTDNKTRHVHKYRLEIYGLKESDFNTGENMLDILPTTQQFIECMRDYFDPYKLTRNNLTLSQLKITIAGDVDPVSVITFKVVYYKQHLPFPVKLTVMERLENYENEIQFLNERIEYEQQNSRRVNKLLRQERRRLSYSQVKIEKMFKENFILKNEICNCPICWEELSGENMHVPICLHPVCKQCLPRITKCPLCREKLVNHDHIV